MADDRDAGAAADDARLSEAILAHLGLMGGAEAEEKIVAMVGAAGLARIKEVDAFANRAEVWTQEDHPAALARVREELAGRYGGFSEKAREWMASRAAWGWR